MARNRRIRICVSFLLTIRPHIWYCVDAGNEHLFFTVPQPLLSPPALTLGASNDHTLILGDPGRASTKCPYMMTALSLTND